MTRAEISGRTKRSDGAPAGIPPDWSAARLDWVRTRRVLAFAIDYALYALIALALLVLSTILVEDLALARLASPLAPPSASAARAGAYYGLAYYAATTLSLAAALACVAHTLGGRRQATPGMRLMSLRLLRFDRKAITPRYAIAHALLFVVLIVVFTPLVLLAPLFLSRKQTLHDRLLDTFMTRDR